MLTAIAIRDVVLIEALDLEFGPGLGVLTGETGAGKSILLDALGLALGARADAGLVRHGATQAIVTASFDSPDPDGPVAALLARNDLSADPGEVLTIRRTVKADGGSRGFVNDQPVSAGLLRELAGQLVEVHGQHDDRGLLNPRGHRALLDSFGGIDTATTAVLYRAWRDAEAALAAAATDQSAAARDADWLNHAVDELVAFDPLPGEEEDLAGRRSAMQRGERITGELQAIADLLDGGDGAATRLRQAARILDRIAVGDAALGQALAAVDRAIVETGDAQEGIDSAAAGLTFDPAAFEADELRLFELRALARKHRVRPDELATLTAELIERRNLMTTGGAGLARLETVVADAAAAFAAAADLLSRGRIAAAGRLDAAVATELPPLKLEAARFRTAIVDAAPDQWSASGKDRVEFEVSTNPGDPFAPLIRIASGGELSRFVLALKVALAEQGAAATMIFDEIDRGVGGAVASAIGERLARLAGRTQLLVVTHSPQVAARGTHHLLIAKRHDGIVTRTDVARLGAAERREEIARMLSGATVTAEARGQAERLLDHPLAI